MQIETVIALLTADVDSLDPTVTRLAIKTYGEYTDDEMEEKVIVLSEGTTTEVVQALKFYLENNHESFEDRGHSLWQNLQQQAPDPEAPLPVKHEASEDVKGVRYGVGIQKAPGEMGMTHGPFESVQEALEAWGGKDSLIVKIWVDGEGETKYDFLYQWSESRSKWLRY